MYTISFWVADTSTSVSNNVGLDPVWDENTSNQTTLGANDFYFAPTNTAPVNYQEFTFVEMPSTSVTRIDLHGIDTNGSILLDNVSVTPVSGTANLVWNNAGATGDGKAWDVTGNQNWNNGGGPSVFHQGDNVLFSDSNNGNYSVTIGSGVTVKPASMTVSNVGSTYTFSGSGSIGGTGGLIKTGAGALILNNTGVNTYSGSTTILSGALVVGVPGALPANTALAVGAPSYTAAKVQLAPGAGVSTVSSLAINTGSALDIGANALAINYGSAANDPKSTVAALLATGYNGGNWTGSGITSSAAAASPNKFALGYTDGNGDLASRASANQLFIAYTLAGDANLDGSVGFSDLLVVAQNYGTTGKDWSQGNFTYDPTGSVGFADLLLIAQNYGQTTTVAGQGSRVNISAALQSAATAVPEPAATGLILAGLSALMPRRRSRCAT